MAYVITNDCINCGACVIECPEVAIFIHVKKILRSKLKKISISAEHYNIDLSKCSGCISTGYPKCAEICPMDAVKEI